MKSIIKTGFILFAICAVCAVLCALVNQVTAPVIAENNRKVNEAALRAVSGGLMPGEATRTTDLSNFNNERYGDAINEVTPLYKEDGQIGGYSLTLSASGYGGPMTIVASYYSDGSLIAAKLTNNSETAGLGKKAENDSYMAMFKGFGAATPIPTSKNDLGEADAQTVSGATITFTGLTHALSLGSEFVKEQSK